METLVFAIIVSYGAHQQQEPVVAEPEEFQPFYLQALRNPTDNKASRSWRRQQAKIWRPGHFSL